jgi:glycosyltransferase involved in cell wall biosynthesis
MTQAPSDGHRLLIPSYNTGPRLRGTVAGACAVWPRVLVVVDGSTDGSDACLEELQKTSPGLDILRLAKNGGKGGAVLAGARWLAERGATHVLCMDADGQHPAASVAPMMALSVANPDAMIMGRPVFGAEAPGHRRTGHVINNFWSDVMTLRCGLGDTLFGMRVYPVAGLIAAFERTGFARGYDFDPEIAVRICRAGFRPIELPVPVRYFTPDEGGVSHFRYLRDNVKIISMYFRLLPGLFIRFPRLLANARRWRAAPVEIPA